jgi:hypothetical protein
MHANDNLGSTGFGDKVQHRDQQGQGRRCTAAPLTLKPPPTFEQKKIEIEAISWA